MNLLAYVHLRNIYNSTGAGRVARSMTEHLARQPGMNLRVLADPGDHARIVPLVGAPWNDFRYHFLEAETSRQQARWMFSGSPRAEHYWPDANLVYCTGESYVPTRKCRLAVTLHDAAYFDTGAHRQNAGYYQQRLKWRVLYHRLLRRADGFHTISEFSAERLAHFFPSMRSRLRVVHNAVADRFFHPPSEQGECFLRRTELRSRPFILLPGGLNFRKNADLVLTAWSLLRQRRPDLRLVVPSYCDRDYAKQAEAAGGSVLLTGYVNDEILTSLYHAAEVVWFPSRYEGFGLPIVEAMACGTPVLASNTTAIPEIAGQAAMLVSPSDSGEHVDAIEWLLDDTRLRAQLTIQGRERAQQFTWPQAAAKLRGFFESLL